MQARVNSETITNLPYLLLNDASSRTILVLSPTIIVKAHTCFRIVERVIGFLAKRKQTFPLLIVY